MGSNVWVGCLAQNRLVFALREFITSVEIKDEKRPGPRKPGPCRVPLRELGTAQRTPVRIDIHERDQNFHVPLTSTPPPALRRRAASTESTKPAEAPAIPHRPARSRLGSEQCVGVVAVIASDALHGMSVILAARQFAV